MTKPCKVLILGSVGCGLEKGAASEMGQLLSCCGEFYFNLKAIWHKRIDIEFQRTSMSILTVKTLIFTPSRVPKYPIRSNGIRSLKKKKSSHQLLGVLLILPLFLPPLLTHAAVVNAPQPTLNPAVIQSALKNKPAAQFPDFSSNYQTTVAIPAQQAQEAAQQAAEQAVAEQAAQNAPQASQSLTTAPVGYGGTCSSWIAAAGISDVGDALAVINLESGCDPNVVNPSSGACGIGQALPCSKMPCAMGDGACQIRWMDGYVRGTYGSWAAALGHERAFGWY